MENKVIIRQAVYEDIPRIMELIASEWDSNHILGYDRELFEWQYVEGKEVYFIIAEDSETKKLYGMMGYNPLNYSEKPDMSTGMKLALKNPEYELLGEELHSVFEQCVESNNIVSPSVRERYAKVLEILNANTIGEMKQYVRIHPTKESFHVACINLMMREAGRGTKKLVSVANPNILEDAMSDEILRRNVPYQDVKFLRHRFFEHPSFDYRVWQIQSAQCGAFLFGREVKYEGAKVLRLVDFVGEDRELIGIDAALDQIMLENDYEYIDFFCYGIDAEIMKQAGFFEHKWDTGNIFPDYFEPFVQKNGKIFFYAKDMKNLHVFKAFGDSDRPRLLQK